MSKISELGPITGANTRTEDLFVIVNLVQGDDGTKNISRKELVEAIQYEIFSRITITGGTISGVEMSDSLIFDVTINDSIINDNVINDSTLNNSTIYTAYANNVTMENSTIDESEISNSSFANGSLTDSTADNLTIINSSFANGSVEDSTANNVTITNSSFADGSIEDSTANNVTITNSIFEDGSIETATANNVTITNSSFTDGTLADSDANNLVITNSDFTDGTLADSDANNLVITSSEFNNGTADSVIITNSEFNEGTADDVTITNSEFNQGNITEVNVDDATIVNSDFSDGTGNNNVFTNTTIDQGEITNSVISNTEFQGSMDNVVATNLQISSSSAAGLDQRQSTFDDGKVTGSTFDNGEITNSTLTDIDLNLTKKFDEPQIDEDSYFALKNNITGETEQFSYKQFFDEISKTVEKSLKVHVAVDGDDSNPGTILQPVQTLERAAELALEKAGGKYDRNDVNNAVHISCGPGTYYTKGNVALPDDCSLSSTSGQYATVIQALPGYERNNAILVGSGCYVQGFSYLGWEIDNFDYPEGGFGVAYRPGAKLRRSPYLRDSTQLSNFLREDVEAPLVPFNSKGGISDLGTTLYIQSHSGDFAEGDEVTFSSGATGFISTADYLVSDDELFVRNIKGTISDGDLLFAESGGTATIDTVGPEDFPNALVGRGGGCVLADRRVLDPDSLYTYVLCFGFTPRTQNGMGYVARDGAGINGIGSLSIFVRCAFYALNGGQMTLNNSGTQFGDISMRAKGSTVVFAPKEISDSNVLLQNTVFADTLEEQSEIIIDDVVEFLTANTAAGGLGYQAYDADKCERDSGIIVDRVALDIATQSNYWGRLAGITYRSPISYTVINEQLDETTGAIRHLKSELTSTFENADQAVVDAVNTSFNEILNTIEYGEEYASPIIFTDTGDIAKTASRELLQDNRTLIQDATIDWIENNDEFFSYDSVKCRRDTKEYILPAVELDMQLDTNYNAVTAGNAYYMATASKVVENQREETIAAYNRLKDQTMELIDNANTYLATSRADKALSEIVNIINDGDKTYTPSSAAYDPVSGLFTITLGDHVLVEGSSILLTPNSFTFTCGSDGDRSTITHPRLTDPAYNQPLRIISTTDTTVTVNVGTSTETSTHTFIKADASAVQVVASKIYFSDDTGIAADKRNARIQLQNNRTYIQDHIMGYIDDNYFVYDSEKCQRDTKDYILPAVQRDLLLGTNFNAIQTGIGYYSATASEVVDGQLPETVAAVGELKQLVANNVLSDADSIVRTDAAFNEIIDIMNNGLTAVNDITWSNPTTDLEFFTPTTATYDPLTGDSVITIASHGLQVGDNIMIRPNGLTFECGSPAEEISHPRVGDPAYESAVEITAVTTDTITVNVGDANGYTGAHTFVSAISQAIVKVSITEDGSNARKQLMANRTFIQEEIYAWIQDNYFGYKGDKCARDVGLILDAVRRDVQTGSNFNAIFAGLAYRSGNASTDAVINEQLSETVDAINFIKSRISNELSGTPLTRAGAAFDEIIDIMENGTGNADSIDLGSGDLTVERSAAVDSLQNNKTFLQDEITAWIAETYPSLTYDVAKCERDVGYLVDSISFDIKNGGNTAAINNARLYFDNAVSILPEGQKVPTAKAFKHIAQVAEDIVQQREVTPTTGNTTSQVFSTGLTPTGATYDVATGVTVLTLGAGHGLVTGDYIVISEEGITFECGSPAVQISHPRATDPAFNNPLQILASDSTTITVNVGDANGYTGVHAFVSATSGSVKQSYVVEGQEANDLVSIVADMIEDDDFGKLPAIEEPAHTNGLEYTEANKIIFGQTAFLQGEVIEFLADNNDGLAYDQDLCYRDIGYIVDAIAQDVEYGGNAATVNAATFYFNNAVNILPVEQREPTRQAYLYLGNILDNIIREVTVTPTTGNTATQDKSGTPGSVSIAAEANSLAQIVANTVDNLSPLELPSVSGAPAYNPRKAFARKSLQANKAFLQQEVISYLNDRYFTYDGEKCKRDVGYIMDSVKRDVKTGSNFNAIFAGLAYRSGTVGSTLVVEDQLAETVAAIENVRDDVVDQVEGVGAKEDTTDAFNELIDIMTNDVAAADTINFGNFYGSVARVNGRVQLQNNKAFLQAEVTAWIADNYPSLSYDSAKCERDVGYILDSVSWDVQHASNTASINNATIYFENAVSILPLDQRAPTAAAFAHLASVAGDVANETVVTPTTGNTETQDFSGSVAGSAVAAEIEDLIAIITDAVTANSLSSLPDAIEPAGLGTGYTEELNTAFTTIDNAKEFEQNTVLDFLAENYNALPYNEAKCKRDVGYIIDAVSHDIQYGGNAATVNAAGIYFENAVNVLPIEQRQPTKDAFEHLGSVVEDIVQDYAITASAGNTETQDRTILPASPTIAASAKALVQIIADIADDTDDTGLPVRIDPNVSWVSSNYVTSKESIEDEVNDLVESTIDFISNTQDGLSFPRNKCRRDIGFLVDAVSHDVQYDGNYATRIAAGIYFENGISVLPFDTREQTAEIYDYLSNLVSDIVQETDTNNPLYTSTLQDVTGTPATSTEGDKVKSLIAMIEDVIREDSLNALPPLELPDTSWVDSELTDAAYLIDQNTADLADDMIEYLHSEFDVLDYNKAKCRRDLGYLIDAFSYDLNYGGNSATRWNADFYFWGNTYRIPEDQRVATAKAYRKLGEICKDVVIGQLDGQVANGELGTLVEADKVYDLADVFYRTHINKDVEELPVLIEPDMNWQEDKLLFAKTVLNNLRIRNNLAMEVVRFVNAEYEFVDINLTRRDATNLIKSIANDFRYFNAAFDEYGSQKATRTFVSSLFDYDGTHVFPVFNPQTQGLKYKGTVNQIADLQDITEKKPNHAYIVAADITTNKYSGDVYYWNGTTWVNDGANNTALLQAFYKSWQRMRDFIKSEYTPDAAHDAMIEALFNEALIDNVLVPETLTFGSLVESIAHQFNGASAGVNRTALPLNFRNLGAAISAKASVLSEDGGRIRWSGADELNNQYFARGLRINGRTGRIEGRPFTSSVRKLARRASNSRAII